MDLGERIKKIRLKRGKTLLEVAKKTGKTEATIQRYESGNIKNLKNDTILDLAKALNVSPAYLMGWEDIEPSKLSSDYYYFPVAVSAGLPINIDSISDSETITIPDELLGKYAGSRDIFFMRVNGESMNKIIPHDSLIAVKQVSVNELKNGDIVVYSNHHSYAVKRFYDLGDRLIFKPESTDPRFTDYIIGKTSEGLRLHGKVVTYIVNLD